MHYENRSIRSIRHAAIVSIFGKYVGIILNLVYSAILSRILTPQDFGVVAVVFVFTTFFLLLANMGIGPAVIQNKRLDDMDNRAIFALTFYVAIIISILFALMSYPLSCFYNNSSYVRIGFLLSAALFFNTVNIVPNALLFKAHRFELLAVRSVLIGIATSILTIYLATIGFGYYSIVIQSILGSILTFAWNGYTLRSAIGFKVRRSSIGKIGYFSKYQFAFSLINYFSRNLDNLLIGRFIGETQLGYYNRSYQLMQYPTQNLTHAITPILHPILSIYENEKEVIYEKYIKILRVLSIIGVFVTVYIHFASSEITLMIFGDQWQGSVRSLQLLSLSIWSQMLTSSSGSIFQSLNKTKLLMITGSLSALIIVSMIILGVILGNIDTVALLVSVGYLLVFFQCFYVLTRFGFEMKFHKFMGIFYLDIFNIIVLYIAMVVFTNLFIINDLLFSACIKLVFLGVMYLMLLILTKQYKYLIYVLGL